MSDPRARAEGIAREHQWQGGYFCSCGHELNSPYGFSLHVLDALLATPDVEAISRAVEGEVDIKATTHSEDDR